MKLTVPEFCTLANFSDAQFPRTAGSSLRTVRALAKAGLMEHRGGSGQFATWIITEAGRSVLRDAGGGE